MRLTLRTLLAYLDDTLEPTQAKLIGQKVTESDAAQELIARIKQVTRRRRLTTPPTSGAGAKLDANNIAEYLDNALSADQLAEVEEICLASDVHLAEAAACLGPVPRRVFLTVGRLELGAFAVAPWHRYLVRTIEPVGPDLALPHLSVILDRGPFRHESEEGLMRREGIEVLVSKNSGGEATAPADSVIRLP